MSLVRYLARLMLGVTFISAGLAAFRDPRKLVQPGDDAAGDDAEPIPGLDPDDTEQVVKVSGAVQVAAGSMLVLNKLPRLSSLALAATVVPTTAASSRFWEIQGTERGHVMDHFLKNLGLFGGLLIAAVDTQGRPGLAWRAQHAVDHAGTTVAHSRREAKLAAKAAKERAKAAGAATAAGAAATVKQRRREARLAAKGAKGAARGARRVGRGLGRGASGAGRTATRTARSLIPGIG